MAGKGTPPDGGPADPGEREAPTRVDAGSRGRRRAAVDLSQTAQTRAVRRKLRPDTEPELSADTTIASRYVVRRFLARGGMGEVYEAFDTELEEPVALKLLPPDSDARYLDRFKREVHLARRVTHRNVCRIYELGHHDTADGELTFLTMELLRGPTLDERIGEVGQISAAETLAIARQIAAALDAAHQAGVVHRDLKPSNVILVASTEEGGEPRVVVADFGVARGLHDDRFAVQVTGGVVGSPGYMAPEQLEGANATIAADIYAFGVILYEMVTGRRPFASTSALQEIVARLRVSATTPRAFAPGLDPRWEAAILRCLEIDPKNRFETAGDVVVALEGTRPADRSGARGWLSRLRRTGARRWLIPAAAALAIAGSVTAAWVSWKPEPQAAREQSARASVAVLGFRNVAGDAEASWLATAIPELLDLELSAGNRVLTVPGEEITRLQAELALPEVDGHSAETLGKIRAILGADYVVVGSFTARERRVHIQLRLQDARSGETIDTLRADADDETELADAATRLGGQLRERLGAGPVTSAQERELRAAFPADAQAGRAYAHGLASLRRFDAVAARDALVVAAERAPDSAVVQSALSAAYSALGHEAEAREAGARAFRASARVPRETRLVIEARYREVERDWDKAVDIYRALWTVFPEEMDHGLHLASAQTAAARGKDALATVEELRRMPPPARDDPRIDLTEARAAMSLSDFRQAQQAAARAAQAASARGQRILVGWARLEEGLARRKLGEYASALTVLAEARDILTQAGDRKGRASAINLEGIVMTRQGDRAGALRKWEEALAIDREIGDRGGAAMVLNNLGTLRNNDDDTQGARAHWEESSRLAKAVGDRNLECITLTNLAGSYADTGDVARAEGYAQRALDVSREIGAQWQVLHALEALAWIRQLQGRLAEARDLIQQAAAVAKAVDSKDRVAMLAGRLGHIAALSGDAAGGRKLLEDAIAASESIGENPEATEQRYVLATLLVRTDPAAAEKLARQVVVAAGGVSRPSLEALAHAVLARALVNRGQATEARRELALATEKMGHKDLQVMEDRTFMTLARASVDAAESRRPQARRELESIVADARGQGAVWFRLEAEAELARLVPSSKRWRALAGEARRLGFGLFANEADRVTR